MTLMDITLHYLAPVGPRQLRAMDSVREVILEIIWTLAKLSERERMVFELYVVEGFSKGAVPESLACQRTRFRASRKRSKSIFGKRSRRIRNRRKEAKRPLDQERLSSYPFIT